MNKKKTLTQIQILDPNSQDFGNVLDPELNCCVLSLLLVKKPWLLVTTGQLLIMKNNLLFVLICDPDILCMS